ncbi:hypothetical protein GCM10010123_32600 [Pilimelia anulata]|uniref:Secreted protein n=1 Tax=Pilimelia anulata TaxID=53371 RepID=A0A8J3FCG0_9ACTN|nr:hypothetical protein [Pilimelia anulata]GGK00180.1 hypothetical protein GCM10010123_32600 [Pilimelia anulata]
MIKRIVPAALAATALVASVAAPAAARPATTFQLQQGSNTLSGTYHMVADPQYKTWTIDYHHKVNDGCSGLFYSERWQAPPEDYGQPPGPHPFCAPASAKIEGVIIQLAARNYYIPGLILCRSATLPVVPSAANCTAPRALTV